MATIKEFSNGKTGVKVFVKVNHSDKTFASRMPSLADIREWVFVLRCRWMLRGMRRDEE
jgi:hypothetical protein